MNRTLTVLVLCTLLAAAGCVERRLTIQTSPPEALVVLNDEQIGVSPVTCTFLWYGDYNVRIAKEGYQTLVTHRDLKAPWYDAFPFDLLAQVLYPGTIEAAYTWHFDLKPVQAMTREDLIQAGQALKLAATPDPNQPRSE